MGDILQEIFALRMIKKYYKSAINQISQVFGTL